MPLASNTAASTSGRMRPAPHGPRGDAAHLDRDRRLLAGAQRGDRARLAAVAGQVLEQLAHGLEPERLQARPRAACRAPAAARCRREGAASARGAASSSLAAERLASRRTRRASAPSAARALIAAAGAGLCGALAGIGRPS